MKNILDKIITSLLVIAVISACTVIVIPSKENKIYYKEIESDKVIEKDLSTESNIEESDIWQLAVSYLGTSGMCETVAINFVQEYLGFQVVADVNTYDVSYEEADIGDYVTFNSSHIGVYLGGDLFLNPNNNSITTISNIWDFGTPTFKKWNGENVELSCLDARKVGYGYQSINNTKGCYSKANISTKFYYIDEIESWTNDLSVIRQYGYMNE